MTNNANHMPWRKIVLHTAAWAIVISLPLLMRYDGSRPKEPENNFFLLHVLTSLMWLPVYYFNAGVLTPKLIYPRKYVAYSAAALGLFSISMFFHGLLFTNLIHSRPFKLFN